jgi:hypothetical protein
MYKFALENGRTTETWSEEDEELRYTEFPEPDASDDKLVMYKLALEHGRTTETYSGEFE